MQHCNCSHRPLQCLVVFHTHNVITRLGGVTSVNNSPTKSISFPTLTRSRSFITQRYRRYQTSNLSFPSIPAPEPRLNASKVCSRSGRCRPQEPSPYSLNSAMFRSNIKLFKYCTCTTKVLLQESTQSTARRSELQTYGVSLALLGGSKSLFDTSVEFQWRV